MGTFLSKGYTFVDGVSTANATNLNGLVDDGVIQPTAISALTNKSTLAGTEEFMINDGGTLKKSSVASISEHVVAIPIGTVLDFAGTLPPTGWFMCYGQAISRSTYSALFEVIGTTYGTGDGSSTFNVPDCRGRVVAGKDDMGGTSSNRVSQNALVGHGINGDNLGAVGGADGHILVTAQLASHTHVGADHTHTLTAVFPFFTGSDRGGTGTFGIGSQTFGTSGADRVLTTTATGGGAAHNNMQPTIVMQKMIKY